MCATKELMTIGLLFVSLVAGCRRWPDAPLITIVIPDGYQGRFEIVADQKHGVDVPLVRGEYRFTIPPKGGILRVKNDMPFYNWAKYKYIFDNGDDALSRISRGYAIHPSRKMSDGRVISAHGDGSRTPFYVRYDDKFRKAELARLVAALKNDSDATSHVKMVLFEFLDAILREDVATVLSFMDPEGLIVGGNDWSIAQVQRQVEEQFRFDYCRFSIHEAINIESIRVNEIDNDHIEITAKSKLSHMDGGSFFDRQIVLTFRRFDSGSWKIIKARGFPRPY